MPVISSPTRSRYSSYIISRSASRIRWRITCLAVCAAMRPKLSGVTSVVAISSPSNCDQSVIGSRCGRGGHGHAGMGEQLLLGERQREHADVAAVAVELDLGVRGGAGRLLV